LERLLTQLEIPTDPGLRWVEQLRVGARSFRRLAQRHRSFVGLLTSQQVHTEALLRPAQATLALLCGAGFEPREADHAYQTLLGYILGFLQQSESGTIGVSCCAGPGATCGCAAGMLEAAGRDGWRRNG